MDKIYIIEDDENIRNLLKIALEGFGYEAEGFETAEEGLERIKEEVPSLAIFDWMLPGMDGLELLSKLKASPKNRDNPQDPPDRWPAGTSHYAFNCQRERAGQSSRS